MCGSMQDFLILGVMNPGPVMDAVFGSDSELGLSLAM